MPDEVSLEVRCADSAHLLPCEIGLGNSQLHYCVGAQARNHQPTSHGYRQRLHY